MKKAVLKVCLILSILILTGIALSACGVRDEDNDANNNNQFDPLITAQDGAYVLTRSGFEAYIMWQVELYRYHEYEIDYVLTDEGFEWYRDRTTAIIHNNRINLFNMVYKFSRVGNSYIGEQQGNSISFSLSGNILNLRLVSVRFGMVDIESRHVVYLQFERDDTISFATDTPYNLATPRNFSSRVNYLNWNARWVDYGLLGVDVEVKRSGSEDFETVNGGQISHVLWSVLELEQGENLVRVTLLGGPFLYSGQIRISTDSEYVTHTVNVAGAETRKLSAPTNIRLEEWTWRTLLIWSPHSWGLFDGAGSRIYTKRNNDFELINPMTGGIDIQDFDLTLGENIVKIISNGGRVRLVNNVLITYTDSPPAEHTIIVNALKNILLDKPVIQANNRRWVDISRPDEATEVRVYVRRPHRSFELLTRGTWNSAGMNFSNFSFELGQNTLRVVAVGGKTILRGGVLITYTDSYIEHEIVVNSIAYSQLTAPTNFRISSNRVSWDNDDLSWRNRIYIRRPNQDSFEFVSDGWSWDGLNLGQLNLAIGENVLKVIASGHAGGMVVSTLENGVLTRFENSLAAEVVISVNSIESVPLTSAFGFSLGTPMFGERELRFHGPDISMSDHSPRIYIRYQGTEDFIFESNFSGWSINTGFSVRLSNFDLIEGTHRIKVVFPGGNTTFDNGVLTVSSDSKPTYVDMVINAAGNVTLQAV